MRKRVGARAFAREAAHVFVCVCMHARTHARKHPQAHPHVRPQMHTQTYEVTMRSAKSLSRSCVQSLREATRCKAHSLMLHRILALPLRAS